MIFTERFLFLNLVAAIATAWFFSEPLKLTESQIRRLSAGRFWSKEDRIAFTTRDLDEFTHSSAFRRALDLDQPANPSRQKLPKRRKRKRSPRRE